MNYRFDFFFSYWILFWFFLYACKLVPYNPLFALLLALFENLISIIFFITNGYPKIDIICFFIVMICIKVVPIIYLLKVEKKAKIEILPCITLFIIYLFWLHCNNKDIRDLYFIKTSRPLQINTPLVQVLRNFITMN
jgi:predicted neutral ceramidase superfamily lipid hydrolase